MSYRLENDFRGILWVAPPHLVVVEGVLKVCGGGVGWVGGGGVGWG